jgi:CheY-like chemotaxis protein
MRPRILFVDDHEDTRNLISYGLDSLGYEVVVTDCTAEGLRLARERRFDLYLLDSQFAEGSGAELCEAIREFDAETPIIYFTGEHPSLLNDALDCPAQGVVLKPDFDKLKENIARILPPPRLT